MGAITLNTLVCGLLYHPVEQHMKIVPLDEGIDNEALVLDETVDEKQGANKGTGVRSKLDSNLQNMHGDDDERTRKLSDLLHNVVLESANEKASYEPEKKSEKNHEEKDLSTILRLRTDIAQEDFASQTCKRTSREDIPERYTEIDMTIRQTFTKENGDVTDGDARNVSCGIDIISEGHKTQPDSLKNGEIPKDENTLRKYVQESCKRSDTCSTSTKESDKKTPFFDLSVLKDPIYLVILISNSTSAISNTNFMILLPSYAIAEGFDKNSSALLLSIVSALDLVGRIGGASLSDIDFVPKYYYFVGGLGTSGIALALLPMATSYTMLSFFCGLFGLSSGMYIGITTVILADMLGTEKLTSSYGISLFVNGVLQLIGPPICGIIFENVLSYKPIFLAFGIILILGTALWAVMPIIKRNNKEDLEAI